MSNPFVYHPPDSGGFGSSSLSSPSGPVSTPRILSPGRLSLHSRPIMDHQFPAGNQPPVSDPTTSASPLSATTASPKFGVINYSPKHSRKPSSLTSNRNISMKNLALDITNNDNGLLYHSSSSGSSNPDLPGKAPLRRKTLNLSIPENTLSKPPPPPALHTKAQTVATLENLATPNVTRTPVFPPPIPPSLRSTSSLDVSSEKYQFPAFNDHRDTYDGSINLQSPFGNRAVPQDSSSSPLIKSFNKISLGLDKTKCVPEELQELSQLDAYPEGPANVLNSAMFLFSEPSAKEIAQYDLVVNVAKECKDLTTKFADDGAKKYVYIPWSHTSPIAKELPALVKLIQEFDDSDKLGSKRKILIHCHCGVSRSACVIVAYFMLKFRINVNEAYELLKSGTNNANEKVNRYVKAQGYTVDACSRVCPNMSLIFELMDFNDYLKSVNYVV